MSTITPIFSAETVHDIFSEVYGTGHQNFIQPPPPEVEMDCSPVTAVEVNRALKRMKSSSAPSPFDRVGYVVFKRCPSLVHVLVHLFNLCWAQSIIPHLWKVAAIRLIAKASANQHASNPARFQPIALTPCIGKLFTTLLRNHCSCSPTDTLTPLSRKLLCPQCTCPVVLSINSNCPLYYMMHNASTNPWQCVGLTW